MKIKMSLTEIHNIIKLTGNAVLVIANNDSANLVSKINELGERVIMNIDAEIEEPGNIVLDKKVINNLPKNGQVELQGFNGEGSIKSDKRFIKFSYEDLDTSHDVPTYIEATLPTSEFNKMIEVDFAVATTDERPSIKGVFTSDDNFVALDGYRLSERSLDSDNVSLPDMIIPTSLFKVYRKLPKGHQDVTIVTSENEIALKVNDTVIVCNLIKCSYPNYRQLINNQDYKSVTTLDAKELSDVLKSYKNTKRINLNIKEEEICIIADSDGLEIKDTVECETWGEDISVNLNIKYLVEALKNYKGEITIKTSSEFNPVYIEDREGRLDLILPIRVNKEEN